MPSQHSLIAELGRVFRFGMTGVVAALAYAAATFVIVETGLSNPVVAAAVGYFVAATISYLGHIYFSFRVEPDHRRFLWRFAVTVVLTFAMTIGCTWLIVDVLAYSYRLSILAMFVLIPATNYACGRFWVFSPGVKEVSQ